MANDSDLYNRWQAAQDYATRVLVQAVKAMRAGKRPSPRRVVAEALGVTLRDGSRARLPRPVPVPAERERHRPRYRPRCGPARHHNARKELRKAIGTMLHDELAEVYASMRSGRLFSPDATLRAGGRCATRPRELAGRGAGGAPRRLAAHHFARAQRHRRGVRALPCSARAAPDRSEAFDRFYERWKDDHLVIDNWFSYQAVASAVAAGTVVEADRHPLFSIKNPNKVRALIGTFAMANPVNFNRPEGAATSSSPTACWRSTPSIRRLPPACWRPSAAGARWSPNADGSRARP